MTPHELTKLIDNALTWPDHSSEAIALAVWEALEEERLKEVAEIDASLDRIRAELDASDVWEYATRSPSGYIFPREDEEDARRMSKVLGNTVVIRRMKAGPWEETA